MPNTPNILLCRYHYDPLDRLAGREVAGQASSRSFYQKNRLTTEIQGQVQRSWLQTPQQLLAQRRCTADISETALIGTDSQGSVLHGLDASQPQAYAYGVYGNRHPAVDPLHLPGFNREQADPVTGYYLLGNGYRVFNPVLMRFNNPDSASPFGRGGLNAYAYCAGDPVNQVDPSGHMKSIMKPVRPVPPRPQAHDAPVSIEQRTTRLRERIETTRFKLDLSAEGSDIHARYSQTLQELKQERILLRQARKSHDRERLSRANQMLAQEPEIERIPKVCLIPAVDYDPTPDLASETLIKPVGPSSPINRALQVRRSEVWHDTSLPDDGQGVSIPDVDYG